MEERRNQLIGNIAAFVFLILVSLYRQISLHMLPKDPLRNAILYLSYTILLLIWVISVRLRGTQPYILNCLTAEAFFFFMAVTIRFLQEQFWADNLYLMRQSGLWVLSCILPAMFSGFYAVWGVGQPDFYHPPLRRFILFFPLCILLYFLITDERRHFFFFLIDSEPQPNLVFHPNTGVFLLLLLGLGVSIARMILLFHRNRLMHDKTGIRILMALTEPVLILLACFPYVAVTLNWIPSLAGKEIIELFAKIFYVEILSWEIYIFFGLVPVNTGYAEMFRQSTIGMAIRFRDGRFIASRDAHIPGEEEWQQLVQMGTVEMIPGYRTHLYSEKEASFLWNEDVRELRHVTDLLKQTRGKLTQQGLLLEEEIDSSKKRTGIRERNRLYDVITADADPWLSKMKEIIHNGTDEPEQTLRQLMILGTFVKRKSHLYLIVRGTGSCSYEDIRIAFSNLLETISSCGIRTEILWKGDPDLPSEKFLDGFESLGKWILDNTGDIGSVRITADTCCFTLEGERKDEGEPRTFFDGYSPDSKGY